MPTIERACRDAGVRLHDLDAIAVTSGPGLAGALLVGVAAAKALALALGKPIYGVNHLASHVAVDVVEHGPLPEPTMALLVSGGHSCLLLVPDVTCDVRPLGSTIDDAAGEAFDKVARVLGLPFPGGPHIDRAAREGDAVAIDFPRGLTQARDLERHRFDFSFSGLKTAVARWVQLREQAGRAGPGRRRGGLVPGGGRRRADSQGGGSRAGRARRRPPADRRRGRCQLAAAGDGRSSAATPRGSRCGCRGPGCAPTTARWSRRSARRWSRVASSRRGWTCPPTRRCRSPWCGRSSHGL